MNLYFYDSDNKQHLVKENIDVEPDAIAENESLMKYVEADLAKRKPDFNSIYKRVWWDEFFRMWIDFGSHTEFYIAQTPDRARNLVRDEEAGENGDEC